jgi:hypothetical protein
LENTSKPSTAKLAKETFYRMIFFSYPAAAYTFITEFCLLGDLQQKNYLGRDIGNIITNSGDKN